MHIPSVFVECLFYVYGSEAEANRGSRSGGTGFLVHYPSSIEGYSHVYAVTNKHVIDDGFCVLRLNRKDGLADTIPTQPEQWLPHPDGDDVAVFPVAIGGDFQWWPIPAKKFISRQTIDDYKIGYGDEVFLIGRLISHPGTRKNTPIIRFGNVALMADATEPMEYRNAKRQLVKQEAFLVECRSLSGFSGSPVFVTTSQDYRDEDAERVVRARQKEMGHVPSIEEQARFKAVSFSGTQGPWLLGIDFGHPPLWQEVYKKDEKTRADLVVDANTGLAGVIPAWRLLKLLEVEKLMKQRAKDDRKLAKQIAKDASKETSIILDSSKRSDDALTEKEFLSTLKKVTRKLP